MELCWCIGKSINSVDFVLHYVSNTPFPFYILNYLAKNEQILTTFGAQNLQRSSHKKILNTPTSPK